MKRRLKRFAANGKLQIRIVYLTYRFCTLFYSFLFLLCRIFPIKKNKIVCCSLKGEIYGDNPKYIADEIINQELGYEIVWLLKKDITANLPAEVHRKPHNVFSVIYHMSTAKVWIDTHMKTVGTLKRKGQTYIQTWHGSYGLKKVACDGYTNWALFDTKISLYNAKIEDIMISNSKMTTSIYRKAFRYEGRVLECGSPRNDIFFEDSTPWREKTEKYFSVCGKQIALYAPTYRGDFRTDCFQMDFEKALDALRDRFGGDWVMLIRLHPRNLRDAAHFLSWSDHIINATDYPLMQELLAACDVLITDYSSCMFDFAETEKPCFIYATDIERYKEEQDFYWDIMSLPFPVAQTNEELEETIRCFDSSAYSEKLSALFEEVGLYDNGTASRQVVEYIKSLTSD